MRLAHPPDSRDLVQCAIEPLTRQVKQKLEELLKGHPNVPEELQLAAINIDEPAKLARRIFSVLISPEHLLVIFCSRQCDS